MANDPIEYMEEVEEDMWWHFIFQLPESVRSANPDAFLPRHIAFGPHNAKCRMVNYKRQMAKKGRKELHLPKFDQLQAQLRPLHLKILVCYDTCLEIDPDRLAEIMLVDALFLLRLFLNISHQMQTSGSLTLPLPNFDNRNLFDNMWLSDVLKLENQIPLLVFKTILSNSPNPNTLLVFLYHFSQSVSPFAFGNESSTAIASLIPPSLPNEYTFSLLSNFYDILNESHHLLHFTYLSILISPIYFCNPVDSCSKTFIIARALTFCQKWLSILGYVLDIDFIQQLNDALGFIQELFELLGILQKQTAASKPTSSPVIPSASQLHKLHFNFKPDDAGILFTKFIKNPGIGVQFLRTSRYNIFRRLLKFPNWVRVQLPPTLHLPVITVNAFTETLFENLLAFEVMANINPPVFTRYIELMKALILTPKDLNILKKAKIIKTHDLENDEQVVKLFNRVGNSIFNPTNENLNHLHRPPHEASTSESESEGKKEIFELINTNYEEELKGMVEEINQCYDSFWIVKAKKYLTKCLRCLVKMMAILGIVFQIFLVAKKLVNITIGDVDESSFQIPPT